ncbi:MAG: hypothetical protein HOE69_02920 [Euryarchaeota archaeon]|jgi:uncharacterized membrane protein|nr:hypothetical protein [Euryarchaeota archaeon]
MQADAESIQKSRIFIKEGWASPTMRKGRHTSRAAAYLFASLLILSLIPTVEAAIGVSLSSSPNAQTINPGENATYDITVTNTGDEDMTVSLATSQAQDCTGFTSTIEQVTGPISGGSSETVSLTVTVAANAEAGNECETTVTGTGTAPLNTPEQGDVIVTSTVGEGSGGAITGVDLTSANTDRTFNGNNPVSWTVNVENTGQTNETIQLSFESNATCESSLSPSVDPDVVSIDTGESEIVTVEVTVPEGTEAGDHCFYLKAVVTTPATPEQASDFLHLNLEVPEMKECSASLPTSSAQVDPFETKSFSITFYNEGNTDWTVGFSVTAQNNWISASGGSTKLLPYNNGNGQATFNFDVSPDDSLAAGSLVDFTINGLDGSSSKCNAVFQVQLGQTKDGDVQLESSRLDNVEPGATRSVVVSVYNLGNGQETYTLGVSTQNGWVAQFDSSSISLEGSYSSSGSSGSVLLDITAPEDALATDELSFDVTLFSSGGESYATDTLIVTVAAHHSMTADMFTTEQFGKTGETSRFPVTFTNTGNVQDSFTLSVCDKPPSANPNLCDSPNWPGRFSDAAGSEVTSVSLAPATSVTVYTEITVQGEDEFESEDFQIRIKNVNDGTVQERFNLKVIVSNHIYRMGIALQSPGEIPDTQDVELPPEGTTELWVIVTNVGSSSYTEEAIISVTGMTSETDVEIFYDNGSLIQDSISLEKDESVLLRVVIKVEDGVENGVNGLIKISASSSRNAAELATVKVLLSIRTNHEIEFSVDGDISTAIEYGEIAIISVNITNSGNVEETIRLLSSEPMRGWAIEITEEEVILEPGETLSVDVVVKPPTNLEQADTFEFTLTAEPSSSPVSAQPIDLSVTASPPAGIFGSGGNLQMMGLTFLALLIFGAIFSSIRGRKVE